MISRPCWLILYAALACGLETTPVVAEQGQDVPKRVTAPAAARSALPSGVNENGWVKLCINDQQTGNRQVCLVNHEELEPNTGMLIVSAAVRSAEGEDTQHLLIGVTTAKSLIMPVGAQIKIDDGEPIALHYGLCMLTSCQVQTKLTKEMIDKLRNGKQMVVAALDGQQQTMAFTLPLTGFGKSFDGAPVDTAKYQEARRRMMETFRKRQEELANKATGTGQKKQRAVGPPQAGIAPTQRVSPEAKIAPPKIARPQISQ